MPNSINAYLHFNGNCREAMTFYQHCLGGELALQTVGETAEYGPSPGDGSERILHGSLTTAGFVLLASDLSVAGGLVQGTSVSLMLNCGNETEINERFAFKEMGYPAYLLPFLGWAKLLGVVAILVPGFPRLKEWAYAGLIFDLLGASYSVSMMGKFPWMVLVVGLGACSYAFYHKKRYRKDVTPKSLSPSLRSVDHRAMGNPVSVPSIK